MLESDRQREIKKQINRLDVNENNFEQFRYT